VVVGLIKGAEIDGESFFNEARRRGALIDSHQQAYGVFEINSNTTAAGRETITGLLFRSAILFGAPRGAPFPFFSIPFPFFFPLLR